MGAYIGGSAFAMASNVAEGNILITIVILKKFSPGELKALEFEIEKIQRDVRSEVPPQDDSMLLQKRNRKISRLSQALLVLRNFQMQKR